MVETDVTLLNNDNSYQFLFRCVAPFRVKKSQPVISLPIVNTTPANTFLFRLSGQTEEVTFDFALVNDGVDVSNGTNGGTPVTTVDDQITYLRDSIYTDNFDVSWTLTQSRHYSAGVTCVITNLDINQKAGGVDIVIGTISFMRGNIGAL